jgi:hypothetical protein
MIFAQYDWNGLMWLWWTVGAIGIGMIVWVLAAVAVARRTRVPEGPYSTDEELMRPEYSRGAISREEEEYDRRL